MYLEKTYKIYINKKPIEVSYFVLLCHCTGEFKYLASKEEYIIFFHNYTFSSREAISEYITNLNSYIDVLGQGKGLSRKYVKRGFLLKAAYRTLNNTLINRIFCKMSLFSVSQLLYEYTLYKYHMEQKDTLYPYLDSINKYINYPPNIFSEKYASLTPHLCFYKRLALSSKPNLIKAVTVRQILKEINTTVKLKDIKEDLEKHMLIMPYKTQYIWLAKDVYDWLVNLDYFIFKIYNLDKAFSQIKLIKN